MPVLLFMINVWLLDKRYEREADHAGDGKDRDDCPYPVDQFSVFCCKNHICGVLEWTYYTSSMREYQQKYMIRTLLYSRVTIVVLFLLCILLLRSIVELNDKRIAVEKLREESASERQELEAKVQKAEEKNGLMATDRGFESYVRTTFPIVKKGEGVIVIYDEEKSPVADVRSDMTVWERLQVFFQGVFAKK